MSKVIYKKVADWLRGEQCLRIVLVGSRYSGKSVFLTSLASQLRDHDEKRCPLNGWSVIAEDCIDGTRKEGDFQSFKYSEARRMLSNGEWPEKTADCSIWRQHVVLKKVLKKSDAGKTVKKRIYLEVMDLPGERVSDLPMIGRSYREWCGWFEDSFGGVSGSSENYNEYVKDLDNCQNADEAIFAYKKFIAAELAMFALSVTPSIVKLNREGVNLKPEAGNLSLRERYLAALDGMCIGLSKESQFVPVTLSWLEKHGKTDASGFKKAYNSYKREIVNPLADWLSSANQVYYFVDVLGLLSRGPEVYNSEKKFGTAVLNLFKHSEPSNSMLRIVSHAVRSFIKTSVDAVYVVAPKIDRVLPDDMGRVEGLAKNMFGKVLDSLEVMQSGVYCCSAVRTTEVVEKGSSYLLQGRVIDRDGMEKMCQYKPAPIPTDWPEGDKWQIRNQWPETFPKFDKREDKAPDQHGLDELIAKILAL